MNETKISWTNKTWNPTHGCSKVSDGCKYCYAAELSLKRGWTKKAWTIPNERENVLLKPHKLGEPYKLKEPQRVFVNSMSDLFHRSIPDWYRAVVFCIMLDLKQHVFQVLTKRPSIAYFWKQRWPEAVQSQEFLDFREQLPRGQIKTALMTYGTKIVNPWADNIWMGTSVEDRRVISRIEDLQAVPAKVKFISAEPLIEAWPQHVDLSGIDWVIVGGESGSHMKQGNPRWMKQEWARHIRDLCFEQGVAFFYKQDSGYRTELRPYLIEEDGSQTFIQDYPDVSIEGRAKAEQLTLF
jgi:protein gp37